ncbi:MAG: cold shock domain-containing protein [Candidatus Thermoplasmatota archaeon]|nr:cold shock domain-containing protein [Candidatus Thermoplasmatota archaeon]
MNDKLRELLSPDTGICKGCADELKDEMKCCMCGRNLLSYKGKVFECPVCKNFYCSECWDEMEGKEIYKGTIKTWFDKRNYGFIKSRKLEDDIFIHADDTDFTPEEGEKVEFEIEKTKKGPRARKIRKAK